MFFESMSRDCGLPLGSVDARTDLKPLPSLRSGIIARDLNRYYALVESDLRGLETKFSAAERMAIITALMLGPDRDLEYGWLLPIRVEDMFAQERLTEQFGLEAETLLAKVAALSRAEMAAFSDAAERWWNSEDSGGDPEQGDLFVGVR